MCAIWQKLISSCGVYCNRQFSIGVSRLITASVKGDGMAFATSGQSLWIPKNQRLMLTVKFMSYHVILPAHEVVLPATQIRMLTF